MLPYLAVVLAAVCFGTTGTVQAFGPAEASAGSVGAARILIGGALLAVIALVLRSRAGRLSAETSKSAQRHTDLRGFRRLEGWSRALLLVVGALGVVAYQPLFFLGTSQNGVAVGTVVALGSAPVITGALDWALRRRFPGAVWLVATAIAMVGVTLISGILAPSAPDATLHTATATLAAQASGTATAAAGAAAPAAGGATGISLAGLAASVGAGASYAVYTLASKALLDRGWTATGTMGSVFGLAALVSIPLLLATDTSWLVTGPGLAMALWLGVVTTAGAYLLFGWGLARLPASTVSTLTLTEPLTATLLGTLVLGETLTAMAAVGLAVLALGLVVLATPRRRLTARRIA